MERTPMAEDMKSVSEGLNKVLDIYLEIVKAMSQPPQVIDQLDPEWLKPLSDIMPTGKIIRK